MALQLHITKPEGDTKYDNELRPIGDVVTFGRRPDNDVVLDDGERQISGRHAKFEYKAGTWFVTDLESRNGTFLDERRLPPHQPAVLHSGSIVQIGLLHIEVALDQSNSDLGRTLVSRDPKRSAAILGERLCDVYAKLRGASPATRNAEMRAAIARVLADSDPTQARVVLSIVRQRYASGSGDGEVEILSQREELFRSGYQTLQDLSYHLLHRADFTSSVEVGKFVRLIQQALDGMLGWVATALQGRAEFKDQFGAEVTQIFFHKEHNPLKSGGGPEEIAKFLLDWSSDKSLGEVRSHWEQALRDLSMHQFSLLRAVQETLRQVFQNLDPDNLVKQAQAKTDEGGWLKKVTGGENPWQIYKAAFHQMRDEQSRFFDAVIYPTMNRAYIEAHKEYLERSNGPETRAEQQPNENT